MHSIIYIYIYISIESPHMLFVESINIKVVAQVKKDFLTIYIYIFKISSQCPSTVGVDYSLHRIYE